MVIARPIVALQKCLYFLQKALQSVLIWETLFVVSLGFFYFEAQVELHWSCGTTRRSYFRLVCQELVDYWDFLCREKQEGCRTVDLCHIPDSSSQKHSKIWQIPVPFIVGY